MGLSQLRYILWCRISLDWIEIKWTVSIFVSGKIILCLFCFALFFFFLVFGLNISNDIIERMCSKTLTKV